MKGVFFILKRYRTQSEHQIRSYTNSLSSTIIRSLLTGYSIRLVHDLQTCFIFTGHGKAKDVTANSTGSLSFVHVERKIIYIAQLPSFISLYDVLSRDISTVLKLSVVLPLVPILTCPKGEILSTLNVLRMAELNFDHERGIPGEKLSSTDKGMLSFRPSKKFLQDEIVAWEDGMYPALIKCLCETLLNVISGDKVYRYGIVCNSKGVAKFAGDIIQRVNIKINHYETKYLPTTKVYVFKSGKVIHQSINITVSHINNLTWRVLILLIADCT